MARQEKFNVWDNIEPSEVSSGVPIFRPSMDEFKDFEMYMKAINKYGMQSGVVKIIPPKEWVNNLPEISTEKLQSIKIRNPIIQHIAGHNGVFAQQNIEKQRTFNIVQWKALSEEASNQPPAPRGKIRNSSINTKLNKKILANKNHNDERLFESFNYNIDTSEFDPDRCEFLERSYWKSLTYSEPLYGADILGSIFDDSVTSWNVANLPNVLDHMDQKLPGVNDAYLYAGLWKATFSWHLEDQDLYSINYIHFGAPKQWYSISQSSKEKFDEVMKETFRSEYDHCHEFLRHKTFLVSPAFLESKGITVNKVVHYEKEFMITYPYGYHAGFNYGYNVAESVNFAIEEWFKYGLKTSKCLCISDSVGIDVERLIRRVRGEPGLAEEKRVSIEETEEIATVESIATTVFDDSQTGRSPKKRKVARQKQAKELKSKERKEAKDPSKSKVTKEPPKPRGPQCLLCPNALHPRQLNSSDYELISTEQSLNGVEKGYCHRVCAKFVPEVDIVIDSELGEYVSGIPSIPNARKSLKCMLCHVKKGACFQCSASKCTRSFHATCSLPAGVYHSSQNEFYCKYHRPKEEDKIEYVSSLCLGDMIQGKFQEFFAGAVVSNNKSEESLIIDLHPHELNKQLLEIPYSCIYTQGMRFPRYEKNTKLKSPTPPPSTIQISEPESQNSQVTDEPAQLLNLKDERYENAVDAYHDTKWVCEVFENKDVITLPKKERANLWYYKPEQSTYQIARYVDDVRVKEPNDPHSIKYYRRKRALEEKKWSRVVPTTSPPLVVQAPQGFMSNVNNTYTIQPPQEALQNHQLIAPKPQSHSSLPPLVTFKTQTPTNFIESRH